MWEGLSFGRSRPCGFEWTKWSVKLQGGAFFFSLGITGKEVNYIYVNQMLGVHVVCVSSLRPFYLKVVSCWRTVTNAIKVNIMKYLVPFSV